MFYILKKYFYLSGTFNAPKSGPMVKEWNYPAEILTFESIKAAQKHLLQWGIDDQISAQTFEHSGRYVLSHGEFARPKFQIRKMRSIGRK